MMEQQQILAEKEAGGALRRMLLALVVAALVAAVLVASAMPAMARNIKDNSSGERNIKDSSGGRPLVSGGLEKPNPSSVVDHTSGSACVGHLNPKSPQSSGGSC